MNMAEELSTELAGDDEILKAAVKKTITLFSVLATEAAGNEFLQKELEDLINCNNTIYKEVRKYAGTLGHRESGFLIVL